MLRWCLSIAIEAKRPFFFYTLCYKKAKIESFRSDTDVGSNKDTENVTPAA